MAKSISCFLFGHNYFIIKISNNKFKHYCIRRDLAPTCINQLLLSLSLPYKYGIIELFNLFTYTWLMTFSVIKNWLKMSSINIAYQTKSLWVQRSNNWMTRIFTSQEPSILFTNKSFSMNYASTLNQILLKPISLLSTSILINVFENLNFNTISFYYWLTDLDFLGERAI